jgi:hypothetical protein
MWTIDSDVLIMSSNGGVLITSSNGVPVMSPTKSMGECIVRRLLDDFRIAESAWGTIVLS